jgi:hypothetical protein
MQVKNLEGLVDGIIREEYGGCHPSRDQVCHLKAKVEDHVVKVFVVGKWRTIRYYSPNKKIPSEKIVAECIHTVRVNTGGTFEGKDIVLDWE